MSRGGRREGAGRKPQGVTKKVSLTLTKKEWAEIEASGLTVAAFLKNQMKKDRASDQAADPINYPRRYADERWGIYLRDAEDMPEDVIESAKAAMQNIMFPADAENAVVRTHLQYECPFTGKRYGSMDRLIRSAIPHLIQRSIAEKQRQIAHQAVRKRKEDPQYFVDL